MIDRFHVQRTCVAVYTAAAAAAATSTSTQTATTNNIFVHNKSVDRFSSKQEEEDEDIYLP